MRYGLIRRLRRGARLGIIVSFDCSLDCKYCLLKNKQPNRPPDPPGRYSAGKWLEFIRTFPIPVKEVWLSGGEVGIYPNFAELVNTLLMKRILVTVYTNGVDAEPFLNITPSKYLRFYMTYHKKIDKNIKKLRAKGFRVDVTGFKEHHLIDMPKQHRKDTIPADYLKPWVLRVGPDGTMFRNCLELVEHYHTLNENKNKRGAM